MCFKSFIRAFSLFALTVISPVLLAQEPAASTVEQTQQQTSTSEQNQAQITLDRLEYVQNVLSQKLSERSALGEQIEQANEQDKADLRRRADAITRDIQQLRKTLETIATGSADTSLFVTEQSGMDTDTDWRQDLTLIAQPVIDSLKELTEKPRRLKELNDQIDLHQQELDAAQTALNNMQSPLALKPGGELGESLGRLEQLWSGRRDDARSSIEIARFHIADLQGDKPIAQTIFNSLLDFITGRGLTLLIAAVAAGAVWFSVRFLLRGYQATISNADSHEGRTRYRLAAYSVHALTFVLSLIAVFVVFYERGDVLLLGLLILLMFGLALGIRHLLPQYLAEARLLLNIGAMREAERISYRGLPWRVEAINMNTVLRNPELHGVLRIPLAEFHNVTSRPSGSDSWFPTSRGDSVLFPDQTLMQVVEQNPDTVELRTRGGQQISVPTQEFYAKEMINLSRGDSFGVVESFGVDYQLQAISLTQVPKVLREAIRNSLEHSDLASFVKDVRVELKQAGSSSIDYWLFVTMDTRAAKSYLRIQRMVQSACVHACTTESWDIPYPHLSLVQKN